MDKKGKHRKSYKREFKLEVDRKCIREWLNKAESIQEGKRSSKKTEIREEIFLSSGIKRVI